MYKWWTVLFTILLLFGLRVSDPFPVESIRLSYFDWLQKQQDPVEVDYLVLVNIDERSIEKYGQYPWPRDVYADLLINYTDPENASIYTNLFSEKDRFNGDDIFAKALSQRLTILSAAPTTQLNEGNAPYVGTSILGKGSENWIYRYPGILSPYKPLEESAYGVGVTASSPSVDGVVRAVPMVVSANDQLYPSIALETLRAFQGFKGYQMKVSEAGIEWVRIGKLPPLNTMPNGDINVSYWNKFESISAADLPLKDPTGKTLVWGVTAEGISNPVPTPMGAMYPHEVQSNLLHTVISDVSITRPALASIGELALVLILSLSILVMVYRLPTALSGIGSLGLIGAVLYGGYSFWISKLFLIDVVYPSLAAFVVFAHSSFNKYYTTFKLKEQIKKQFGTYLSPDMVQQLQDDPSLLKLGGERKEMSFMFMDICGFTPISEHYKNNDDPEGLVDLINKFLDVQTKIILNNSGTVDKYMGDCIMAFWNAPLPCKNHADMAVKTSIEIIEATKQLNEELKPLGLPPINVGIGVNTGTVICGNMGSEVRFDYTVIGDAVNLAARLESQTRNYDGVDLLLSEFTREASTTGTFTEVDRIKVKGKTEEVTIYTNT